MRLFVALLACSSLLVPARAEMPEVSVRVEKRSFPVVQPKRPNKPSRSPATASKLDGKKEYSTEVITLSNGRMTAEIVPELGGRLIRLEYTAPGADTPIGLLWENDEIPNRVSWSMGGAKWSFPHWEHGRKFAETAGYVITRDQDGAVTVSMDMRFDRFLTRAETRRYGLATNLRLVMEVRLTPGASKIEYVGRIENPLPIRYGTKLWFLVRPKPTPGAEYIFPVVSGTDHNAPSLKTWRQNETIGQRQDVFFALGRKQDFAGWWYPKTRHALMLVWDHQTAPGAKQVLYKAPRYVELWGGNNEVFEEAGRMLPAFGQYEIRLHILAGTGPGKPVAATAEKILWPGQTDDAAAQEPEAVSKEDWLAVRLRTRLGADGREMPGGPGAFAELTDLTAEHHLSLPRWYGSVRKQLAARDWPDELWGKLDLFRRAIRVAKPDENTDALIDAALAQDPANPHANLYKAIQLHETGQADKARPFLAKARTLPGGIWLAALADVRDGKHAAALARLERMLKTPAAATFGPVARDISRRYLQPGAAVSPNRPQLLRAILLAKLGRQDQADRLLQKLIADDPALIEARILAGDDEALATLCRNNADGRAAAKRVLTNLRSGTWAGIGRPD